MKEVVDLLIEYWQVRRKQPLSLSDLFFYDLQLICLRNYRAFLTGGKVRK